MYSEKNDLNEQLKEVLTEIKKIEKPSMEVIHIIFNIWKKIKEDEEKIKIFKENFLNTKWQEPEFLLFIEEPNNHNAGFILKIKEIKQWIEDNDGFLPSHIEKPKTEKEEKEKELAMYINRYTNKNSKLPKEKQEIIKELIKGRITKNQHEKNVEFEKRVEEIKQWIEDNDGFLPSHIEKPKTEKEEKEKELAMYITRYANKNSKSPKEKQEIIKELVKGRKTKNQHEKNVEFEKKVEEIKQWIEDNDGFLPSQIEKPKTEKEKKESKLANLIKTYTKKNSEANEENQERVKELVKGKVTKKRNDLKEDFEKELEEIKQWIEDNDGFLPSHIRNPKTEKEKKEKLLAMYIHKYTKKNSEIIEEKQEIMKKLVKGRITKNQHEKNVGFEKKIEEIKQWIEDNDGFLPSRIDKPANKEEEKEKELGIYINTYTQKGKKLDKEKQEIMKELIKGRERREKNQEESINNIITILETIIERVGSEGNVKKVIPKLQEIIEIYELFTPKEKINLEHKEKGIKKYLDELILRKENIENISVEEIMNIKEQIIESIRNNPTIKAGYIAFQLQNSMNKEDSEENETMEKELFSLRKIVRYLKFKSKDKQDKDIIISNFETYIDNVFKKLDKNDKKIDLVEHEKLEIKSHFITFFENFNEEDFENLKKDKEKLTEEGFFDLIIDYINNSTISISSDKTKPVKKIFEPIGNSGKYVFKPGSGGDLDLLASYNKKIIVGSTTGIKSFSETASRTEGNQLLLHPLKSITFIEDTNEIIQKEIENYSEEENGEIYFSKNSIFKGMKVKVNDGKYDFEIKNEEMVMFKNLIGATETNSKFEKMDNSFVILKVILNGERKGKNSKELINRLEEYRTKLYDKHKAYKTTKKQLEDLGFSESNTTGKTHKIKSSEVLDKIKEGFKTKNNQLIQPILDIPQLTQKSLSEEENKFLITLQLNLIREYHLKYLDEDFMSNYQIRAPFIQNYSVKLNDRLEITEKIGKAVLKMLINDYKRESEGLEELSDEENIKIIKEFFEEETNKEYEISKEFFEKFKTDTHEDLFKGALRTYLRSEEWKNVPLSEEEKEKILSKYKTHYELEKLEQFNKKEEDIVNVKGLRF